MDIQYQRRVEEMAFELENKEVERPLQARPRSSGFVMCGDTDSLGVKLSQTREALTG